MTLYGICKSANVVLHSLESLGKMYIILITGLSKQAGNRHISLATQKNALATQKNALATIISYVLVAQCLAMKLHNNERIKTEQ